MEYCQGPDWWNRTGKHLDCGDAKADDEPRDYLAASSDEAEEALHLSASSGGPSFTIKKEVKTKNANEKKEKKSNNIMHLCKAKVARATEAAGAGAGDKRTPRKLGVAGAGAGALGDPLTRRGE